MLAMLLMVAGVAVWLAMQSQKDAHALYKNQVGTGELGKATSALWQLRYGFPQFMVSDSAAKQKIVADEAKWVKLIDDALVAYEATELSDAEAKSLKSLKDVYEQYAEARPKWFALQLEGKPEEAADWRAKTTTPFGAGTIKGFGELIDVQAKASADEVAVLAARTSRTET